MLAIVAEAAISRSVPSCPSVAAIRRRSGVENAAAHRSNIAPVTTLDAKMGRAVYSSFATAVPRYVSRKAEPRPLARSRTACHRRRRARREGISSKPLRRSVPETSSMVPASITLVIPIIPTEHIPHEQYVQPSESVLAKSRGNAIAVATHRTVLVAAQRKHIAWIVT
eukprot:6748315-Prymnesium_polylepis.1